MTRGASGDIVVSVTRIRDAMYRIEVEGRNEVVYAAGLPADRWIFWNGQVFHGDFRRGATDATRHPLKPATIESLTASMPARVVKILVEPGVRIKGGETAVVLEAMKMELPVRTPADAIVVAVRCAEGELVQADAVLVELRPA